MHGVQGVGAGRVQCMVSRDWVQGENSAWCAGGLYRKSSIVLWCMV